MIQTFEINPWKIVTHQLDKDHKRLQESMTSIGNGYMGMRGMFEEDYSGDTLPGIYIGGVWYPDKTVVGWWKNGYPEYFGKVINAINFIKTNVLIDGEKIDLAIDQIREFELSLDMHNGILTRQFEILKGDKKIHFKIQRFVSVSQKQLFDLNYEIENRSDSDVSIEINSEIDADVKNEDANYDEKFWEVKEAEVDGRSSYMIVKTKPNNFGVPRFTVGVKAQYLTLMNEHKVIKDDWDVQNIFKQTLSPKKSIDFEKRVVVVTSRDYSQPENLKLALNDISSRVIQKKRNQLIHEQSAVWNERWEHADVEIEGNNSAQQGIRFNLFQLFSTFYGEDKRLNIGPKGFTGEKYGGATYWDTEAFAIPMYMALADQSVARNLLEYRHNQLAGAFHNAQQQGLKGALFPMVTFNGIENHNEWEITFEEIHRNGTIAYAIYNYTRYTGDESYLLSEGIEVLTAISKFWADRVHFSSRKQVYMIHGVTGPNEYENNVNNNWYTNLIAKWTLKYTMDTLGKLDKGRVEKLKVTPHELRHWSDIIDHMYLPKDSEYGIFLQQDNFLDKELKPASSIPINQRPINQHWSWDKILRSPYIKQADVLQGIWYFIDQFSPEEKKRNYDFYEPLTVHESSLSAAVHSILAADLRYEDKAVEMYERTARLDLDNYNNDTDDGLHITSMTGSWLAIVQGFAGMRIDRDGFLSFKPFIPKKWSAYQFRINFRNRLIKISVKGKQVTIKLLSGSPLSIKLNGKIVKLEGSK